MNKTIYALIALLGITTSGLIRTSPQKSSRETAEERLMQAAYFGCESTARLLIEKEGAAVNYQNSDRETPLYWAAMRGHESTARLLIEKGADVNYRQNAYYHDTPLLKAAMRGHESTARLLLEHGADINYQNKLGNSPLSIAARNGHESTVRLLIEKEAEINYQTVYYATPLYLAARNGQESTVRLLLMHGAHFPEIPHPLIAKNRRYFDERGAALASFFDTMACTYNIPEILRHLVGKMAGLPKEHTPENPFARRRNRGKSARYCN